MFLAYAVPYEKCLDGFYASPRTRFFVKNWFQRVGRVLNVFALEWSEKKGVSL